MHRRISRRESAANHSFRKNFTEENSVATRRRKRSADDMDDLRRERKRSRSNSYSTTSVSTISTRSSRSPSPHRRRRSPTADGPVTSQTEHLPERSRGLAGGGKKRRRTSSQSSTEATRAERSTYSNGADGHDRNTRMRRSSTSPAARGRRRSRSTRSDERRPRDSSIQSPVKINRRKGDATWRATPENRPSARTRLGPGGNGQRDEVDTPNGDREISRMLDAHAIDGTPSTTITRPRERSLSPYSKRIALTRGTNT